MWNRWQSKYRHWSSTIRWKTGILGRHMQNNKHRAMVMFHSIVPQHDRDLHLRNSTAMELRTIIRFLRKQGTIVPVTQWMDHPEPHQYAITFDDGLLNNLRYAAPVLAEMQVPASYYINTPWVIGDSTIWTEELAQRTKHYTGCIALGQHQYRKSAHNRWLNLSTGQTLMQDLLLMTKDGFLRSLEEIRQQIAQANIDEDYRNLKAEEIRLLAQMPGVTIGSHGIDHCAMTMLGPEDLADTLRTSKTYLEQCTGQAINELAFPFGLYNAEVHRAASQAGYRYKIGVEKNESFGDVAHRFGFYNHATVAQQLEELSTYQ
jgi:peptidoglycan/xylan/chitin deacetylase (PgdA/CDA1 family)